MTRDELRKLWSHTLRHPETIERFDRVAEAVLEVYKTDEGFREHIGNRSKRVVEATGVAFDAKSFDIEMARAFIADEIGFDSWTGLAAGVDDQQRTPVLFLYAKAAMWRGDFTSLEEAIEADRFYDQIKEWYERGLFHDEQETLSEILSAACMLGQTETAAFLIDEGVDPYAGMRMWLAGPHWAASSGRLDVVKMLIERRVPLEVKNKYGGTVLGQALWSAINEHTDTHAEIIERLIEEGAVVEPGTDEWWAKQDVPSAETKRRVADVLNHYFGFHARVANAREQVTAAEESEDIKALADALKELGNILRRPPFGRDAANEAYTRAAELYGKLNMPLEEAWVKRHIGINHEYAERLDEAEKYYDESLALFRAHASEDDNNYANTVRYPAVIKNRLGKRDESRTLWEEAVRRYQDIGQPLGVAEGAAWLAVFASEKGDRPLADEWLTKAEAAALAANDPDTDKWIAEVRTRLNK